MRSQHWVYHLLWRDLLNAWKPTLV
jgi:hypothetical protein